MAGTDLNGTLTRELDDYCNARIFSMIGPVNEQSEISLLSHKLELAHSSVSKLQHQLLDYQRRVRHLNDEIQQIDFQNKVLNEKLVLAKNEATQNAVALKRNIALCEELRHELGKIQHERNALERHVLEAEELRELAELRATEADLRASESATRMAEAEERRALAMTRAVRAEKRVAELENQMKAVERQAKKAETNEKTTLHSIGKKILASSTKDTESQKQTSHTEAGHHNETSNEAARTHEKTSVSQRPSRKRTSAALDAIDSGTIVPEKEHTEDFSKQERSVNVESMDCTFCNSKNVGNKTIADAPSGD
eukprot:TRINITY_DN22674_c0_g1_i1.p1 TRINITY_DN22674_c0_g1~~TRINITY_DN22674_c0_g1_i1.p1  ORF type:complete len:311 (-),score=87.50 TRINITY_DN22674_c0_g1_i1:456-1388(-)